MGYLLSQMFWYLLIAFLLGLALGWILWGHLRSRISELESEIARLRGEADRLKAELDACGRARAEVERRLREAEAALASTRARATAVPQPATSLISAPATKAPAPKKPTAPKKAAAPKVAAPVKPDNLRRMIGIGPVNEKKLNGLGIRTFAQIAAWTAADIKRVEAVLEFDGRIDRERWIEQARLLAAGDEKEFLRRFPSAGGSGNT